MTNSWVVLTAPSGEVLPGLPREADSSHVGEALPQDLGILPCILPLQVPHGPGKGPDVWEATDLTGQQ